MVATKSEYLVGNIKPTNRPGVAGDPQLNDELPAAIKLIGLNMNFTRGNEDEFGASMPAYEAKVKELADMGADLIRPGGAPPFMMLGFGGEAEVLSGWEKKYGIPMFTSGQNHARALRALGVKRFVGASYFPKKLNDVFAQYFIDAGFEPLTMEGIKVPFEDVPTLTPDAVYDHIKKLADAHPEAEGIYMLGSAWKTLSILDRLEQDLGLPVVHPMPARNWETQLRLGFSEPVPGYGRLLAEMVKG
jgi:maleate cis-trans isomerase